MLAVLVWIALSLLSFPTVVWMLSYFSQQLYLLLVPVPDLKKKYDAKWALVTGGSSGIGRAIVQKLAMQGLNIVVVGLKDKFMDKTEEDMKAFPELEFRFVPVSFAPGVDYMKTIKQKTKDIEIQCIFNNAGYLVTGFFEQVPVEKQLANLECNATAATAITHHFLANLISKDLKGCIVFTSSVVSYIPAPFSVVYGATKAYLSQFAVSIAIENKARGIDICTIHPSPVASNFYENQLEIEMMDMAKKSAVKPDTLPDRIFKCIGRVQMYDMGQMAVTTRTFTSFLPYSILSAIFAMGAPYLPDYKKYNAERK